MAPEASVQATTYTVNCVPEHILDSDVFAITVEYTGGGRWAIRRRRWCLHRDGTWEVERIPSERGQRWLSTHRFDLDVALKLAELQAPQVTVNGVTAVDAIRSWARTEVPS